MSRTRERTMWNARDKHRHGTYSNGRPLLHPAPWTPVELNDLRMEVLTDRNEKLEFQYAAPSRSVPYRLWRNRKM